MQIFVQTLSSKTLTINVCTEDTVGSLMQQLEDREGIPCAEQILLHRSCVLSAHSSTLQRYGVGPHSSVQMLLGLRGGGGDGGATCNDRLWVDMRKDILNAQGDTFDKRQVATYPDARAYVAALICTARADSGQRRDLKGQGTDLLHQCPGAGRADCLL